ncbi:MAG: ABC transporter ATP-binding protein [Sulfolobales archaeon]
MLRVRDLRVYIGSLYILQGIHIDLNKGEILFLIGRNGAGKTTLLKTIMGFIKPSSGTIELDGIDITGEPPYVRARLGIRYVPDTRRLFTSLSVEENLMTSLLGLGLSKEKAMDRIEYVYSLFPDLKRLRKLRASQLSGGQQQMLNLGRAIASPNIKILLVDEPIEGLSPLYASKISDVLSKLSEEGISMIIVETRPMLMKRMSGRYAIINGGRIVSEGSTEDLHRDQILINTYLNLSANSGV